RLRACAAAPRRPPRGGVSRTLGPPPAHGRRRRGGGAPPPPRITAEEARGAGIGAQQAEQDPQGRRLAGTVRSQEAVHLTVGHGQVQPIQRARLAEVLDQARHFDCHSHASYHTLNSENHENSERTWPPAACPWVPRRGGGRAARGTCRTTSRLLGRRERRSTHTMTQQAVERDEQAVGPFIERFASVLVEAGVPPMPARVFAALLVTDSGRLTAPRLPELPRASPAPMSRAGP